MYQLFCDGGVVGSNPSAIGGTYAWRQVVDDQPVAEGAHFISARDARVPAVTNNLTEMLALIKGLESLPADWRGTVLSDSQITLGRAFLGWKWNNIPLWAHHRFQAVRTRLVHFDAFEHVLLAGHPTRAQLAVGIGRHGYPVSIHNVWCDKACTKAGEDALGQMQAKTIGEMHDEFKAEAARGMYRIHGLVWCGSDYASPACCEFHMAYPDCMDRRASVALETRVMA